MTLISEHLQDQYKSILLHYIAEGGEPDLELAYEFGRQAIDQGISVLQVVDAHYAALSDVLARAGTAQESAIIAQRVGNLLKEALGPFEMTQRGYIDSIDLLRSQNEKLSRLVEERSQLLQQREILNKKLLERSKEQVGILNKQLQEKLTQLELVNDQLAESRDQALHASNLKSTFVATMSHELRTPLAGIMGILELVLDDKELNHENEDWLEMAQGCANTLHALVNDVLDISKIEAGWLKPDSVAFDPTVLIQESSQMLAESAQNKQLSLTYRCDSPLPESVLGDPARIRQVLLNLISNSIKFTSVGEISVEANIDSQTEDQVFLRIAVKDSGIGISEQEQELLFLPFSQVDSSDTRPYGGIGLGLFICKSLVELMGGTIGFESKKGRGSVFWFVVPFKRVTAASVASACDLATPETTALASVLHDKLVLVVEDNPTLQSMVIKQLASLGAQVQAVSNGRKAIDAIANRSYDLVFMDCHLPGMSGFEATRKIREMECAHQRRIPIVAMTAGAMKGDREKCIAAGMDEYLSKPFTMQQLHQKLEEVLFVHSHKRQQPENVYDGQQSA